MKSEFLRAHYKKEKDTRIAQWRENEMEQMSDEDYEMMRATRFSDLNKSMRFQGRKLSPRKSRRSSRSSPSRSRRSEDMRMPPSHRHSSLDMYNTSASGNPNGKPPMDRTEPNEVWPIPSTLAVDAVIGGGRQPVGDYGRDSVTGTHTTSQPIWHATSSQPNLSYSPVDESPGGPFIPVLLAPRRSSKRVSDVSRRQFEVPHPGTHSTVPGGGMRMPRMDERSHPSVARRGARSLQPIANTRIATEQQASFVLPSNYVENHQFFQGDQAAVFRRGVNEPMSLTQYMNAAVRKNVDIKQTGH